jgi:hypothetical protein
MTADSTQRYDPARIFRLQVCLFIVAVFAFLAAPVTHASDSRYVIMLSECFIHHRSPNLDLYYSVPVPYVTGNSSRPEDASVYQLVKARGHVTYYFPHGSSMLSMPLVGLFNALGLSAATPDGHLNLQTDILMERMAAALLMAALTCIIFSTALTMLSIGWSVAISLGASFGTQILSTASRGMWSHTWEIVLLGLIAHALLHSEHSGTRMRPAWIATLATWSYIVRPTGAIAMVAVGIYVLAAHRRDFVAYAATLGAWCAAFVAYSWATFGAALPPYYAASRLHLDNFATAVVGNLVSPNRGELVYVPASIFVLCLAAHYRKHLAHRGLAILALAQIAALAIVVSSYPMWWAGWSYGPRFLTDAIPWFVLLVILGIDAMLRSATAPGRRLAIAVGGLLLALSIALNARGAFSFDAMEWNDSAAARRPERIFDWRYPQFMAGLIDPPRD